MRRQVGARWGGARARARPALSLLLQVHRPAEYSAVSISAGFRDYGGNTVQGSATTADWTYLRCCGRSRPVEEPRVQMRAGRPLAVDRRGRGTGLLPGFVPTGRLMAAAPTATAPTVRWESPRDGQTVSGIYSETPRGRQGWHSCQVEARDNVGIDRTDNLVDGEFHDRQISAPYSCEWDTREVPDGRHTLTVVAYDRAGNSARSTIVVTVRNASVSPPASGCSPPPVLPSTPAATRLLADGLLAATANDGAVPRRHGGAGRERVVRQPDRGCQDPEHVRTAGAARSSGVSQPVSRERAPHSRAEAARRLGTRTTLAKGSRRLAAGRPTVILLRPSRRVARRLLRVSKLDATLRVQAKQPNGVELRLRRHVTLRR